MESDFTPAQQDAPTDAEVIEYLRELGDSIYVVIDGERAFLDKLKFARALLARFAVAAPAWHRVPLDLIEFPPRACLAPASPSPASPATHP